MRRRSCFRGGARGVAPPNGASVAPLRVEGSGVVADGGRIGVVADGGRIGVVADGGRIGVMADGGRIGVVADGGRIGVMCRGWMWMCM